MLRRIDSEAPSAPWNPLVRINATGTQFLVDVRRQGGVEVGAAKALKETHGYLEARAGERASIRPFAVVGEPGEDARTFREI